MKKMICFILLMGTLKLTAQQVARGRSVELVSQPNTQLVIRGGITFTGTASFNHKGNLVLLSNPAAGNADWLDSTAGGVLPATSTGMVRFNGTVNQQNLVGPTSFYGMSVQGRGVLLDQSNEVRNRLQLTDGLIYFNDQDDSIYVSSTALDAIDYNVDSFATTSWVHGRLSRRCQTNTGVYFFPVGKIRAGQPLYAPVKFLKQANAATTYTVEYIPGTPMDRNTHNALIDHISSVEYWEITSSNFAALPDNIAKLSLSWRTSSVVNASPLIRDSLLVAHYFDPGIGFSWEPEYNMGGPQTGNVIGDVNFGFVTTNEFVQDYTFPHRFFTLATRSIDNILPVSFLEWDVVKVNKTAVSTWKIFDDRDVDIYIIERSADGIQFNGIGTVNAVHTAIEHLYTFTDQSPVPGWNYYRIKAVSGVQLKYTSIKRLYFEDRADWLLYPVPAHEQVTVTLPVSRQASTLRLLDASGRLVSERPVTNTTVVINISSLPNGMYYMEWQEGEKRSVKRFIKQ